MNASKETRTWEVSLITPLHIGDGQELIKNMDYMPAFGGGFDILNIDSILDELAATNPAAIKELGRNGFKLEQFVKDYRLKPSPLYHLTLTGGGTPDRIRRQIKDAFGNPYLVGSSLKGAIGTALWTSLQRQLPPASSRDFSTTVQKVRGTDQKGNYSPHHDFMRPLQVSDSGTLQPSEVLRAEEIKFFNLRQENQPGWKDFASKRNMSDFKEAAGIFVEALRPETRFQVQVTLDQFLREPPVSSVFSIQRNDALADFNQLAKTINAHSLTMVNAEWLFFKQFGNDTTNAVRFFYSSLANRIKKLNSEGNDGFIIRLAWGSGWRGMTGNWLKEDDMQAVRKNSRLGKSGCPECHGFYQLDKKEKEYRCKNGRCSHISKTDDTWYHPIFPKSRRLVMKDGIPSEPLGWVHVTLHEKKFFRDMAVLLPSLQLAETATHSEKVATKEPPQVTAPLPTQSSWEGCTLGWQSNTGTLTAIAADGRKAEIKMGSDRSLISDEVIARLRKGKTVKAKITVEPVGGKIFRIVSVEV